MTLGWTSHKVHLHLPFAFRLHFTAEREREGRLLGCFREIMKRPLPSLASLIKHTSLLCCSQAHLTGSFFAPRRVTVPRLYVINSTSQLAFAAVQVFVSSFVENVLMTSARVMFLRRESFGKSRYNFSDMVSFFGVTLVYCLHLSAFITRFPSSIT